MCQPPYCGWLSSSLGINSVLTVVDYRLIFVALVKFLLTRCVTSGEVGSTNASKPSTSPFGHRRRYRSRIKAPEWLWPVYEEILNSQ